MARMPILLHTGGRKTVWITRTQNRIKCISGLEEPKRSRKEAIVSNTVNQQIFKNPRVEIKR